MKIGIVGLGIVGSAIRHGFEKLNHDVSVHDISQDTKILDVVNTQVCYICVPTPYREGSSDNSSIVRSVIRQLVELNYDGVIAVKSTVLPGSTERFISEYQSAKICFVPEFLRERCAVDDFIIGQDLCVIGTEDNEIFELVKKTHGPYPEVVVQTTPTEAEFIKYFNNTFSAALITYANSLYEVCRFFDVDYDKVKSTISHRSFVPNRYLDCDEELRGFGGPCLPKDTKTFDCFIKSLGIDVNFFESILDQNKRYKTTVFKGMRDE